MNRNSRRLGTRVHDGLLLATAALGVVVIVGVVRAPREAWAGVLSAAIFGISIVLGAATFVAVQGASGGTWWLPIRRVPMSIMASWPFPTAILAIALLLGLGHLYPWADAHARETFAFSPSKAQWLSAPAFLVRAGVIVAAWAALFVWLRRVFDTAARPDAQRAQVVASIAFLLILGPTLSIASFDWVMSTSPSWYSTAYGVYEFAGSFQAGIAAIAVVVLWHHRMRPGASANIRHDLGKLLFAFSTFWAYIWFCQYMLIWYTNLPEEVPHYMHRLTDAWRTLFWLTPVLCFVVPFVALLSARAKRHPAVLASVSVVVLAGRWLDAYVQIGPARHTEPPAPVFGVAAGLAVVAGTAALLMPELTSPPPNAPPRDDL